MSELLRHRIMMQKKKGGHNLPSGYIELDYIEAFGGQYIDTGLSESLYRSFTLIADLEFVSNAGIVGNSYASKSFYMRGINDIRWLWAQTAFDAQYSQGLHTYECSPDGLIIDGINVGTQSYSPDHSSGNLMVGWARSLYDMPKAKGKYYYFMSENLCELIPCIRETPYNVGMYDIFRNTFCEGIGGWGEGNRI